VKYPPLWGVHEFEIWGVHEFEIWGVHFEISGLNSGTPGIKLKFGVKYPGYIYSVKLKFGVKFRGVHEIEIWGGSKIGKLSICSFYTLIKVPHVKLKSGGEIQVPPKGGG
jgi:hypothetical protein